MSHVFKKFEVFLKSARHYRTYSTVLPEVRIIEVGPRDGLQNESKIVETDVKIELINRLAEAGLKTIEATSFVSPKWVPQMADNSDVMARLRLGRGINYPVLVPNLKGYNGAKASGAEEVAVFPAASESFSQKNLNNSIHDALKRCKEVADQAKVDGIRVRGYVSCVVGCPYEGPIKPKAVAEVTRQLLEMGCYEISLGDTIGVGTAGSVRTMMKEVLQVTTPDKLALHFHDTYGQALSNVLAGFEFGVTAVDSAISGLGGCPYARGASGNLATEDLVYLLYGLGVNTNIDLITLIKTGRFISNYLGKPTESKVNKALGDKYNNSFDIMKLASSH